MSDDLINVSITDTMKRARESFINQYGRLLTEEEACRLTTEIRKELKGENISDDENSLLYRMGQIDGTYFN